MMCCLVERSQNGRYSDGEVFQVLGKVSVVDDLIKEREIAVKMVAGQCSKEKSNQHEEDVEAKQETCWHVAHDLRHR